LSLPLAFLVNGIAASFFARGREGALNIRGALLHLVSDAVVSAGVVVAGLLISITGWLWVSLFRSLVQQRVYLRKALMLVSKGRTDNPGRGAIAGARRHCTGEGYTVVQQEWSARRKHFGS
jgi:hypothetical protein